MNGYVRVSWRHHKQMRAARGTIGERVTMGVKRTHDMLFGGGGVQHEASFAAIQALMSLIVFPATRNVIL